MRLLLDTHVVLWWLTDDGRLGPRSRAALQVTPTDPFVSSVTVAEIATKASLGKLPWQPDLLEQLTREGFAELPFTHAHAAALERLPMHHRDPFDRMLVVQAQTEGLTLLTADTRLSAYDVETLAAE